MTGAARSLPIDFPPMPPTLAAWLHNLSPFLIRFSGDFGLRWYGLAYATGFVIAWWWLRWMSKRGMTPLSVQRVSDAMLILVLGVVVGGRLGYVLFYARELITDLTSSFPWWGVLRLNRGGMSSHGGMIGVIIATWFIARGPRHSAGAVGCAKCGYDRSGLAADAKCPECGTVPGKPGARPQRLPWLHVLDLTAVVCTAGLMLGRVANFINGELLGKIVAAPGDPAPWWSVKFPQEVLSGQAPALNPAQEAQLDALIAQCQVSPSQPPMEAYERVLHALQSGGTQGAKVAQALDPLISARYPSQLMQAGTDGLILGAALWFIWRRPRKPGVIGCWFLILYGLLRISTEFIRLPDPQLAELKQATGLSMGQWLSVLMFLVGAIAVVFVSRRDVPKMGGWARRSSPTSPA
jgi:phosphatidylglycerol---prolipoprotein diacylglyceryl transferase